MALDRSRELAKSELDALPETRAWPVGARPFYSSAYGTWEGYGFDNLVMSASLDRYFVGPQGFDEVVAWYENHLRGLGWPAGTPVNSAYGTRWHRWKWELETIDLIDRVVGPEDPLASQPGRRWERLASEPPPAGRRGRSSTTAILPPAKSVPMRSPHRLRTSNSTRRLGCSFWSSLWAGTSENCARFDSLPDCLWNPPHHALRHVVRASVPSSMNSWKLGNRQATTNAGPKYQASHSPESVTTSGISRMTFPSKSSEI
jgi:hypothetical protein